MLNPTATRIKYVQKSESIKKYHDSVTSIQSNDYLEVIKDKEYII